MTDIEVKSDEWAQALGWYSLLFGTGKGKRKPSRKDIKAKNKFTVFYEQAKEDEELYKNDDDD